MLYIPEYFTIQELVPEYVYKERGELAWELLDPLLLETIDVVRRKFGPATINNWHIGGNRQWSGLRTAASPVGSQYSQHMFGRAADMIFKDTTSDEATMFIMKNQSKFPLITGIELNVGWLHIDVRNTKGVKVF